MSNKLFWQTMFNDKLDHCNLETQSWLHGNRKYLKISTSSNAISWLPLQEFCSENHRHAFVPFSKFEAREHRDKWSDWTTFQKTGLRIKFPYRNFPLSLIDVSQVQLNFQYWYVFVLNLTPFKLHGFAFVIAMTTHVVTILLLLIPIVRNLRHI